MAEIFRKKSLERLSTPDRLDQLLRVVKRRSWIPLLAIGAMLLLALVWCVVGRIPVTADATAVIVHRRTVVPVQPQTAGELAELRIHVGSLVGEGDVIGLLRLPDLEKQLELEKDRHKEFQARSGKLAGFNRAQVQREKTFLEGQRAKIQARIESLTAMASEARAKGEAYHDEQRKNLVTTRAHSRDLDAALKARLESQERLRGDGLATEDTVVNARQRWVTNRLELARIDVQLQELELRKMQTREAYEKQMDLVADLRIQLEQLELKAHEADMRLEEADIQDETSESQIVRTIDGLKSALEEKSRILADHAGTVLEITVSVGSLVTAGQRIASMAVSNKNLPLVALAYFDVADGKKIEARMSARISPVTVQKQRFGSMVGHVSTVSAYPVTAAAVVNEVGNKEMAQMLVGGQSRIEVEASLELDPATTSGFRWTSASGPDTKITAGTTASVRVTIEERAPITLLMPALRGWLGLD